MGKGHKTYWFEGSVLHVDKERMRLRSSVDKLRGRSATDVVIHNDAAVELPPVLQSYLLEVLSAIKGGAVELRNQAGDIIGPHDEVPLSYAEVHGSQGPTVDEFKARFSGLVDALQECRGFLALHHSHERGGPHSPTKGVSKLLLAKVESALESFQ